MVREVSWTSVPSAPTKTALPRISPGVADGDGRRNVCRLCRAFQIYMSIYLTQPVHYPEAPAMLKYIQIIRDLSERGSNWKGYDESFRALRGLHSWGWDMVESKQWLTGQWVCRTVAPPFRARRPGQQSNNPCFAFHKGLQCDGRRCRYQHKCKRCGAGHPATQCPRFRHASTGMFPAIATATLHSKHQLFPSSVSPSILRHVLEDYDNNKTQYLTQGFTHGFRIGYIDLRNKPVIGN